MKIAAAQISCVPGDRQANLGKVRDFSVRAKKSGVELIVFPEMIDTGYSMPTIQKHAAAWKEGAVPELQKMAKELSLGIVCGVSDREREFIYNAQVLVGGTGEILAKYRKRIWWQPVRSTSGPASTPATCSRPTRSVRQRTDPPWRTFLVQLIL